MLARSPVVEEFYNHVHGKGGRFASSSSRIGTGKSGVTSVRAGTSLPTVRGSKKGIGMSKAEVTQLQREIRGSLHRAQAASTGKSTGSPARYTSKGPAVRKGFDKIIAAHRAGKTSATHSQAKIESPGAVYTKLAGSHTIRKLKNGRFILHERNQPPIRTRKSGADHIKMLDESTPTMADKIAARVHRIMAKDYDDSTWRP